jgi:DNA-binding response OmpR family regulator
VDEKKAKHSSKPTEGRVLVLEPDEKLADAISNALGEAAPAARVDLALSLPQAQKLVVGAKPDLFVLDIDATSDLGQDFLYDLRTSHPNARAIILTGVHLTDQRKQATGLGGIHFLEKPFPHRDFVELVQAVLRPAGKTEGEKFRGTLSDLHIPDIIQLKCMSGATSALEFSRSHGEKARVFFENGQVRHATAPGKEGMRAFNEIVKWKGGTISEVSNPGPVPATINLDWQVLLMEAMRSADEEQEVARPAPAVSTAKRKLLVIDDSLMLLSFVEEVLTDAGHQVVTAPTAKEGLELAKSDQPELILLDYLLPDMRGDEVTRKLFDDPDTANVPIVYMSGFGADLQSEQNASRNVIGFLNKPFTSDLLVKTVEEHMPKPPAEPEPTKVEAPATAVEADSTRTEPEPIPVEVDPPRPAPEPIATEAEPSRVEAEPPTPIPARDTLAEPLPIFDEQIIPPEFGSHGTEPAAETEEPFFEPAAQTPAEAATPLSEPAVEKPTEPAASPSEPAEPAWAQPTPSAAATAAAFPDESITGGPFFCGDTSFFSVNRALRTIAKEKLTGWLRAFWPNGSVELLTQNGEIILATTRDPQLYCPDAPITLVNVDPERIEAARDQQGASGCPLFLTLAQEGLILREPALQLVQHYGQKLFAQLWTAPRVRFLFERNREFPGYASELAPEPDVDHWALASLRFIQFQDLGAQTNFDPACIPAYTKEGFERAQNLKLTVAEAQFASQFNGVRSVQQIARNLRLDLKFARLTLFRFLALEIVECWPSTPAAKPEKKSIFQRFTRSVGGGE